MQDLVHSLFWFNLCFDLFRKWLLKLLFSATCLSLVSSLRMIFQIQIRQYNWTGVFQNLKSCRKTHCSFTKFEFKYEHNHSHKNKKPFELKHIWTRNRFYFFFHFMHCSHTVAQYIYKNTLTLAFYSSLPRKIAMVGTC